MYEKRFDSFAEANQFAKSNPSATVKRDGIQFVATTQQPSPNQRPYSGEETSELTMHYKATLSQQIRSEFFERQKALESEIRRHHDQALAFKEMALANKKQADLLEQRLDEEKKRARSRILTLEEEIARLQEEPDADTMKNYRIRFSALERKITELKEKLQSEKSRNEQLAIRTGHGSLSNLQEYIEHLEMIRSFFEEQYGEVCIFKTSTTQNSGLLCSVCDGTGGLHSPCRSCDNGYLTEIIVKEAVQYKDPEVSAVNKLTPNA